jgi:hypothetical protein
MMVALAGGQGRAGAWEVVMVALAEAGDSTAALQQVRSRWAGVSSCCCFMLQCAGI